ncbi:hypothetical protein [Urbifossiella limnaea]|uniref:Uncharacterized protein n=1 Tax=Urbifossiella limnaea TaxID=2528023 RepID=A0A517Y381_9BACT|nr:hypothetical protein [Urbifossiella limnaea]QDU24263.1 hypothetical protein ETAA1_62770 [Urbifossiella limnaea]
MSEPANPTPAPDPVPPTVEALQRQIEELRWQLARKTTEADIHRAAVYDFYRDKLAEPPLTEDEIRELLAAPQSEESLLDILEEYERRTGG